MNFYTVIIGTELLNGRREDGHFKFVNSELLKRGWVHKANFIIKDEPQLIEAIFRLVKADENSVMFSFGGIGATPDDLTREIAGKVFRDGEMEINAEAKKLIESEFGKDAYPNRINMANIPINSKLLSNIVNRVPGFYLDRRFFFVPGFVSMSHPMVLQALQMFYPKNMERYSHTFTVQASENDLISIMKNIPEEIEFSSLPIFDGDNRFVEIFISSYSKEKAKYWFDFFIKNIELSKLNYKIGGFYNSN